MSDKHPSELPLGSEDAAENELWNSLGQLELAEPSANLRRNFYRELEYASRRQCLRRFETCLVSAVIRAG